MYCGYCGKKLNKNTKMCPYCKTPVEEEEIEILDIDISDNLKILASRKPNNKLCNISMIMCLISIIFILFLPIVSLILEIFSIIIYIKGKNKCDDKTKKKSFIIFIASIILIILSVIILILSNLTIKVEDRKLTLKENIIELIETNVNKSRIKASWKMLDDNGKTLISFNSDGTYYCYTDSNNLDDNYFTGNYEIKAGKRITNKIKKYQDKEYYYYTITTSNQKRIVAGESKEDERGIFKYGFIIKINKKDKTEAFILENYSDNSFELEKK